MPIVISELEDCRKVVHRTPKTLKQKFLVPKLAVKTNFQHKKNCWALSWKITSNQDGV